MKTPHLGFSLTELLTTLTLVIILSLSVTPNASQSIIKNESISNTSIIYRALQSARTEAIRRQSDIRICGSNDGITCIKEWQNYLIIFQDKNKDKKAATNEIVTIENFTLRRGFIISRFALGRSSLSINGRGETNLTGSFIYCPTSREPQYIQRITWNRIGRPYLGRDLNKDGIIDNTNGTPLSC
ncbi:GspH/FimT family protein [Dasania marina]|uniref:GspH/FimT family pseudopilin n=1 Tax=Dasania marina TaxID=471499 RepID=UPI0030DD6CD2